ncbi:MAG: calcium-binding protein, partial [Alphaproteobacteria bacterium]
GDKLVSVENITSGAGADTLIGDAAANLLRSGDGEDRLEGMGGRDTLIGDDGDDQLEGGGDDDTLYGGMGNDTLLGGKGDDYLYAELDGSLAFGKNTLIGGDGKDWLYGGAHTRERFIGGAGTDYINGGGRDLAGFNDLVDYSDSPFDAITRAGVDVNLLSGVGRGNDAEGDFIEYLTVTDLTGSLGNDRLKGNEKSNFLKGLGGDDTLIGEKGIDTLIGGGGDDVLEGGEGLDTLVGGGGKDVLTGGGDSMDEFVFTAVSDSKAGADDTLDWIKDFDKMDYIHVNYIDFDVIDPEHNDPIFIDNADFSGKAGELRYTESSIRGAYRVEADINGDKTADFAFLLSGVSLTRFSFTSTPINIGEGRF